MRRKKKEDERVTIIGVRRGDRMKNHYTSKPERVIIIIFKEGTKKYIHNIIIIYLYGEEKMNE